ncbi:MAG: FtsX-like permease family protein [Bacteroidales bacterium]|nr:FtsX-like permease family protein [Bacteroidales bacterium]
MIKQHLRQAWTMMKQQKLFTSIYIAGTAISIAMAMTIFVVLYIKLGPLYPEENRDSMVIFRGVYMHNSDTTRKGEYLFELSLENAEKVIKESKYIKEVCIKESESYYKHYAFSENGKKEIEIEPAYVDNGFWRVFNFKFLHGHPFTEADEHNPVAVITASLAEKLYASTDVVGREVYIDSTRYDIIGVVENPRTGNRTQLTGEDIFTSIHYSRDSKIMMRGDCRLIMLAESPAKTELLRKEIEELVTRIYQDSDNKYFVFDRCDVRKYWQAMLYVPGDSNWLDAIQKYLYALLAFLFIPALNLSGMIASRMSSRLSEISVRKSYGATNGQIISQVLYENLLLTFVGAVIGVIFSYIMVCKNSEWVMTLLDKSTHAEEYAVSSEMLFNPTLIASVLLLTLLLNISSALVPTIFALKRDIVQALYQRR